MMGFVISTLLELPNSNEIVFLKEYCRDASANRKTIKGDEEVRAGLREIYDDCVKSGIAEKERPSYYFLEILKRLYGKRALASS